MAHFGSHCKLVDVDVVFIGLRVSMLCHENICNCDFLRLIGFDKMLKVFHHNFKTAKVYRYKFFEIVILYFSKKY